MSDKATVHTGAQTIAFAARAVVAMPFDPVLDRDYSVAHDAAGLITVAGFLIGFALSRAVGA
jgi:hypothetical protein